MSHAETIRAVLVKTGAEQGIGAMNRAMAGRFREAMKAANPQLSIEQVAAYDEAFAEEIPAINTAILDAQTAALANTLSQQDVALLALFAANPRLGEFFALMNRMRQIMGEVAQEVAKTEGVAAHKRSSQAAFAVF